MPRSTNRDVADVPTCSAFSKMAEVLSERIKTYEVFVWKPRESRYLRI